MTTIHVDKVKVMKWKIKWHEAFWSNAKEGYVGDEEADDDEIVVVPSFVTEEEVREELAETHDHEPTETRCFDFKFELDESVEKNISEITANEICYLSYWIRDTVTRFAEEQKAAIESDTIAALENIRKLAPGNGPIDIDVSGDVSISISGVVEPPKVEPKIEPPVKRAPARKVTILDD